MTDERGGTAVLPETTNSLRRPKLGALLYSDSAIVTSNRNENDQPHRRSSVSVSRPMFYDRSPNNGDATPSPNLMSPWNPSSPFMKSPWMRGSPLNTFDENGILRHGLIGSLIREEGHVYSLASSGDFLYTGSDSKNIRVWKNLKDFSGFKSNSSGTLVKAIVISGEKIFTGHQDGKIRVWKFSPKSVRKAYKRVGSLPTTTDFIKSSFNPRNYVEVRCRRNVPWIKHFDAVSCMSLDLDQGLLYSGSWDKTLKVWRISDSKCLESINAHDDALNSVVAGFEGLIFTGSADGTVKVWRRELLGKRYISKHVLVQVLLKQKNAITALAANASSAVIYCGSSDGLVNFWKREKHLSHGGVLRGHKLAVLCLAAAGNLVFSGSADKSICVWRREGGGVHTCLSVLTGHSGPVKCLAVEEDDNVDHHQERSSKVDQRWIVYSGSLDKSVNVWRVSENVPT